MLRQVGQRRVHLLGRQQHHRRLPRGAGEHLAAHVHQLRTLEPPVACQGMQRLHRMAAEGPQVARSQAGEQQLPPRQQRRGHMRKQQVTEVVPVESAEQDDG